MKVKADKCGKIIFLFSKKFSQFKAVSLKQLLLNFVHVKKP